MQKVETYPSPLGVPDAGPNGGTPPNLNGNITVGVAVANVGDLVGGGTTGFPVFRGLNGEPRYPKAIALSVVGANEVRVGYYQNPVTGATPTGDIVPQQPAEKLVYFPDAIQTNNLRIISGVAATIVTYRLEY